jgi:hypothetical protein
VVCHPLSFSCRVVCHAYINEIPCNTQICHRRSSSSSGSNVAPCTTSFISVSASDRSSPFSTYMSQHPHMSQPSQPASMFAADESWGGGLGEEAMAGCGRGEAVEADGWGGRVEFNGEHMRLELRCLCSTAEMGQARPGP